jgi:hypothetical protein
MNKAILSIHSDKADNLINNATDQMKALSDTIYIFSKGTPNMRNYQSQADYNRDVDVFIVRMKALVSMRSAIENDIIHFQEKNNL